MTVVRWSLGAADFLEFQFHCHLVDAVVRQREEERDAVRQIMERAFERFALTRAFNRGGVLDPPMRAHRLAGPDRARLAGSIIADGEEDRKRNSLNSHN